jgi:hypothetical protein
VWLRRALAVNGAVFVLRGTLNVGAPDSFYLPPDPPRYARDVVRLLGVTYLTVASAQLQTAWRGDDSAVRGMGVASMLFAGGAATVALSSRGSSLTGFDRFRAASALENAALCLGYGALLTRARPATAAHPAAGRAAARDR